MSSTYHYNHDDNMALSSLVTCHWDGNESNTTGAKCGTGTAYPSGLSLVFVRFVLLNLLFSV